MLRVVSVRHHAEAVNLDDEIVAQDAYLIGVDEFHLALMAAQVHLECDDLALLQYATASDVLHEVGHLLLLLGIGRRIEACDASPRLGVAPRKLLRQVADGLKTDGGLSSGHRQCILSL